MAAADARVEAIMNDDVAVKLDGVTKRFGTVTALREAHLSIRRGELMALLGPSGCGKTTLLNLVAGFFPPDEGDVTIDRRRVNHVPTYKREIGIMFQNYALFTHMTVAGNVGYGLRMRGVGKAEMRRRVAEALALVRLSGVEDRKPRQLSGGQQQRVAIARALVINPKVLLLDEPFSALDRNLRTSMQIELKEIQRKLGVTTIFVTHDQGEALSLADRIAVMSEGRICQIGTPEEIYRRPSERFVVGFVGDVNVLRGQLENRDGNLASVRVGAARVKIEIAALGELACGGAVDLFIRPEQLQVGGDGEACAIHGVVAAQVYQGGHVDLYLEEVDGADGRVLMRVPGHHAVKRWSVGSRIGIRIDESEIVGFPGEGRAPG
jgi:putative spermidine/putrescine transport system ATP-binding protein/spermidine/putrescine transport system ATP-binding protein